MNTRDSHVFQEMVNRKFAQEAMSLTFFLSKYLFPNHKNFIVWRATIWLHILLFHKASIHFRGHMPTRNKCVCVCTVCFMAHPAHGAKFLLHVSYSHQSQTSYHWLHLSGLQIGANLEVLDEGCMVDGVTLFNQIPWRFLSLQTYVHPCTVMLKQDCCWILLRPNPYKTLPAFCQHPDVGITSWLSSHSASHPQESPLHSPRRLIMALPTDNFFFQGDWEWCHSMERLCLRFKMMDPGFIC